MPAVTAELGSIRKDVKLNGETPRAVSHGMLAHALLDVLDAAITPGGTTDLRQGILTAVYNYDTESFEIRWDIAK